MDWPTAVLDALEARGRSETWIVLGIDGPDCAGKTTLADAVAETLGGQVTRLSVDDFLTLPWFRYARGELSPEGCFRDSFDNVGIAAAVEAWRSSPARRSGDVLIADGVFLQRTELRSLWDLTVYLDVTPEVTLERALLRDVQRFSGEERVRERYERRYLPAQVIYRREAEPLASADLVLPG